MNNEDARYQERVRKIEELHKQHARIVAEIKRRNIEEIEKLELISEANEALQDAVDSLR